MESGGQQYNEAEYSAQTARSAQPYSNQSARPAVQPYDGLAARPAAQPYGAQARPAQPYGSQAARSSQQQYNDAVQRSQVARPAVEYNDAEYRLTVARPALVTDEPVYSNNEEENVTADIPSNSRLEPNHHVPLSRSGYGHSEAQGAEAMGAAAMPGAAAHIGEYRRTVEDLNTSSDCVTSSRTSERLAFVNYLNW